MKGRWAHRIMWKLTLLSIFIFQFSILKAVETIVVGEVRDVAAPVDEGLRAGHVVEVAGCALARRLLRFIRPARGHEIEGATRFLSHRLLFPAL